MDSLYLFCHSKANDLEIQHSLRSLARYLPFVHKGWIDDMCRPDTSIDSSSTSQAELVTALSDALAANKVVFMSTRATSLTAEPDDKNWFSSHVYVVTGINSEMGKIDVINPHDPTTVIEWTIDEWIVQNTNGFSVCDAP